MFSWGKKEAVEKVAKPLPATQKNGLQARINAPVKPMGKSTGAVVANKPVQNATPAIKQETKREINLAEGVTKIVSEGEIPNPKLNELSLDMIVSHKTGKNPAPPSLYNNMFLVKTKAGKVVEYSVKEFPSDVQRPINFQYRSGLVSEGFIFDRRKVIVSATDIRETYERVENSRDLDAPIEEAKTAFKEIIAEAIKQKVSDIHIIVRKDNAMVLFRSFGDVVRYKPYPPSILSGIVSAVYNKAHDERSNSHSSFSVKLATYCTVTFLDLNVKLRWQTVPLGYDEGFDVVLRLIAKGESGNSKPMTLEQLGYVPSQARLLELVAKTPRGGIFIAGVTGSGKSKTLQTLMSIVAHGGKKKVYSVEDPIEYPMFGVSQIMVQRNESTETNPFAMIMKTLMRGDPDAIMAGEIRDEDTAQVVQDIIRTGHHLLTTVHASSAMGIIGRLASRDIGMAKDTISEPDFLSALVYQHLVPTLCPSCKINYENCNEVMDDSDLSYNLFHEDRYALNLKDVFVRGEGCPNCKHGINGVTVCAEIILPGKNFEMLTFFRESRIADALKLYKSTRHSKFSESDCEGKTAVEIGIYKVSRGLIDPRDLQDLFGSLSLEEINPNYG